MPRQRLGLGTGGEPCERVEQQPVGLARAGVHDGLPARDPERPVGRQAGGEGVEQAGLSRPRLARHKRQRTVAAPAGLGDVEQDRQLGLPSDAERVRALRGAGGVAVGRDRAGQAVAAAALGLDQPGARIAVVEQDADQVTQLADALLGALSH